MATKAELLEKAKKLGLSVNTKTSRKDLVSMLEDNDKSAVESSDTDTSLTQSGDNNDNGEKTNGTTESGSTEPVTNETSVPQNGVTAIETTEDEANPVTKEADEARTEEEVKFADESNPNQKARDGGAPGEEFDQDGNQRTGGYSYGVAADDPTNTVPATENQRQDADDNETPLEAVRYEHAANREFLNDPDSNNKEWSLEDQKSLEDSLSDEAAGISARVSTSAGDYVRVKFFYNNKALGTYTSRKFVEGEARKFLSELRQSRDV